MRYVPLINRNIVTSYVSQALCLISAIAAVPLYLRYMGSESYGLVAISATAQIWFQLLDLGSVAAFSRETSRIAQNRTKELEYCTLLNTLRISFLGIALVTVLITCALAKYLASIWTTAVSLSVSELTLSIQLISVGVAIRWVTSLYRGMVVGAECIVWLSVAQAVFTSARSLGVLPLLYYVDPKPSTFLGFQIAIAIIELYVFKCKAKWITPQTSVEAPIFSLSAIRSLIGFSLGLSFSAVVSVALMNIDKVLLSTLLPLATFGYFSASVTLASGVIALSAPIVNILLPALTRLESEGNLAELLKLYRRMTRFTCATCVSLVAVLWAFAELILQLWSNDTELAVQGAKILKLYVVGNGLMVLAAFPYYLQYAKGSMRMHLSGNLIFALALIPLLVWATTTYGAEGAGWVWALSNLAFFLLYTPIVHRRFLPGNHLKWIIKDIVAVSLPPLAVVHVAKLCIPDSIGVLGTAAIGLISGLVGFATAMFVAHALAK